MQSAVVLIKKLGHDIEEIRVRALNNILMKLSCQVISAEDLAESHELFVRLINWFKFPICPEKEKVLELILTLAKTETGRLKFLDVDPRLKFLRDFDVTESERKLSPLISNIIFAIEYSQYPPIDSSNGHKENTPPLLYSKESGPSKNQVSGEEKPNPRPDSFDVGRNNQGTQATNFLRGTYQFSKQKSPDFSGPNRVDFRSSPPNTDHIKESEQLFKQFSSNNPVSSKEEISRKNLTNKYSDLSNFRNATSQRNVENVETSTSEKPRSSAFNLDDIMYNNYRNQEPSNSNSRIKESFRYQFRTEEAPHRIDEPSSDGLRYDTCGNFRGTKSFGNWRREEPLLKNVEPNLRDREQAVSRSLASSQSENQTELLSARSSLYSSKLKMTEKSGASSESGKCASSVERDEYLGRQTPQNGEQVASNEYKTSASEKIRGNEQNHDFDAEAVPNSLLSVGTHETSKSRISFEEPSKSSVHKDGNLNTYGLDNALWRSKGVSHQEERKHDFSALNKDSPLPYQSPSSFQLDALDAEVFKICTPKWQTLILSDYHVLSAVSQSLSDPELVEHSCHFFMTVLIRDFPAPVFIQHSSILKSLLWLLKTKSPSSKAVIACLNRLITSFLLYSTFIENPATISVQAEADSSSSPSSASSDGSASSNKYLDGQHYNKNKRDKEDLCNVRSEQISIPQLCSLITLHLASHISEVCGAVHLLRSVLKLFTYYLTCDSSELWLSTNLVAIDCCQHFDSFMADIAVAYKTWAGDSFKQLRVVATVCEFLDALVPLSIARKVIPATLQDVLSRALLDPTPFFLYPKLHSFIFQYVQLFQSDVIPLYKQLNVVKESMTAAGLFLQSGLTSPISDALQLMVAALPSLPFHSKFELIHMFVYFCSHKIISRKEDIELSIQITLKLVANSCDNLRSYMYSECHKLISSKLGLEQAAKTTDPIPHLKFILNSEVLSEFVLFGVFDSSSEIQNQAREMLVLILSCRRIVPKYSFKTILMEVAPVLPLLECFAEKNTELGRCILGLLNPDTSPLSQLQLLTGNLRLMFRSDSIVREEGIARIMWLMHTTTVVEQASEIFMIDKPTHPRQTLIGVYEIGSMCRVLELLTAPCVEERLRRSALIQLSVMTEDWRLHDTFLEQKGLKVIIDILKNEIDEPRSDFGRDTILSTTCILKNLVRHNTHTRLDLSTDFDVCRAVFLGLLKYHDELRLRRDSAELLSLLLFAEQILTPTLTCISVVDLAGQSIVFPFDHSSHSKKSSHSESLLLGLLNAEDCKRCLSIHWCIVSSNEMNIDNLIESHLVVVDENLPVSEKSIFQLQSASLPFSVTQLLYAVQNATDHSTVVSVLDSISRYLEMYWLVSSDELSLIPFKASLERFLISPPSNTMDQELLVIVLKFISDHAHILQYHLAWLSALLADERNALSKLVVSHIGHDNTLSMWKEICIEIFHLSKKCIQLFTTEDWKNVSNNIEKCLRFSHTQHFYNLAFLDSLLSCFIEITTSSHMKPVDSTVLWELISAFHCSNPQSFMGLSVTRNTLILLNHLFHYAVRSKRWEDVWLTENRMMWFPLLFSSRDVIVRASAFQLVSGLTSSRRGVEFMLNSIESLWSVSLASFMDHEEASLVRENAAYVCSNIISHGSKELMVERCREIGLFQELSTIVAQLKFNVSNNSLPPFSEFSSSVNGDFAPTTPGLLKAACNLVTNLSCLSERSLHDAYHEGFSPALFRISKTFQVPDILSADIITMLTAIFSLLANTMNKVDNILAPNCTVSILPLLNTDLFDESLTLERDALWIELWFFLSTIPSTCSTLVNLSESAISALVYSLSSANRCLQMNALVAVRSLSPSLSKDVANELTVSLLSLWDRFASGNKRIALYSALGQLFMDWSETSLHALKNNFSAFVLFRLKNIHVNLSVAAPDVLRSKKNHPNLTDLFDLLGLLSNFLAGSELVKKSMAENGLAATLHNLWVWCSLTSDLFLRFLETLCTFTADSSEASHSLSSASVICGKTPRTPSLLHALIAFVSNENSSSIGLHRALTVLTHSCQSKQCRLIISKNQVITILCKIAEMKKVNEDFETTWLKFFCTFSSFNEGQISLIQLPNFFDSVVKLATHSKSTVRILASNILMNLAFYHPNQSKIISSDKVLIMLSEKLDNISHLSKKELKFIAVITWSLAANCQKAKLSLKRVSLPSKLQAAASSLEDVEIIKFCDNIASLFHG